MKKTTIIAVSFIAVAGVLAGTDEEAPAKKFHEWSGSRTIPVHRIRLSDENGERITPDFKQSLPFSSRKTCGACHNYNQIGHGWHFNYGEVNAPKGRRGQPWIWYDQAIGQQIPISGRGWTNTWKVADAGLTPWTFVKNFGRNLPGGGLGESDNGMNDLSARWEVSGKLEIGCLACHSGSVMQDHSEWAKQIARENFRWASTAAAGLGEVGGMATRMPSSWTVMQGQNPDDNQYAIAPSVKYDTRQFDKKNRVLIDLAIKPKDQNCLFCHSVAEDGKKKKDFDEDVHTRAGMACVDCHRNGIDHMTSRNYETEAAEKGDPSLATSSCRGCHLGVEGVKGVASMGGRLGAPRPKHKGIPPIHFDKVSCTTCHSGPWPSTDLLRVRTARANRLGITGVADWVTDLPYIVEPVFMKGDDGKIAPHRVVWPALWVKEEAGVLKPLSPEAVNNAAGDILLCQKSIAEVLNALNAGAGLTPVLIASGKVLRANADNGLEVYSGTISGDVKGLTWALAGKDVLMSAVPKEIPEAAGNEQTDAYERIRTILKAFSDPSFRAKGAPVVAISGKVIKMNQAGNDTDISTFDEFKTNEKIDFEKIGKNIEQGQLPGVWLLKDGKVEPFVLPGYVMRSVCETAGTSYTFTEEQVAMVLKALADKEKNAKATFGYICSGKIFSLASSGKLEAKYHPAAEPAAWPLAHEVRPKTQSLAVKKCIDCHSAASPFFFGMVTAIGPMKTSSPLKKQMYKFQGGDVPVYRAMMQMER